MKSIYCSFLVRFAKYALFLKNSFIWEAVNLMSIALDLIHFQMGSHLENRAFMLFGLLFFGLILQRTRT